MYRQAAANGRLVQEGLSRSHRYLTGWLSKADPKTGLIPRNLQDSNYWNGRDAAADNYPFMVLATFFTEPALFGGRMREMLATEQRLCNRVGSLPDDWLFATQEFRAPQPSLPGLIFGASEYAKDGLLPLTEWLGPSPWSERLLGLVEAIWQHADHETEVGRLPAVDHEVVIGGAHGVAGEQCSGQHAVKFCA